MGLVELFLVAVSLSMDAFAVAICKGLGMKRLNMRQAAVIALFFGGFQALMPVIGWALGGQFAHYVTSVAHWIAFALLAFIGAKMIWDAFHEDGEDGGEEAAARLSLRELVLLAVATSIDALAVGVTFAFLDVAIVAIGLVYILFRCLGKYVGSYASAKATHCCASWKVWPASTRPGSSSGRSTSAAASR